MEFSCQKFRGGDGTKINIYVHVLVRVSVCGADNEYIKYSLNIQF